MYFKQKTAPKVRVEKGDYANLNLTYSIIMIIQLKIYFSLHLRLLPHPVEYF